LSSENESQARTPNLNQPNFESQKKLLTLAQTEIGADQKDRVISFKIKRDDQTYENQQISRLSTPRSNEISFKTLNSRQKYAKNHTSIAIESRAPTAVDQEEAKKLEKSRPRKPITINRLP